MNSPSQLRRAVSLPLLVAYGVGTMVGGGFYALLGRMTHHAGMHMPIAILLAAAIAILTALSFSELAARLPFSAGESRYVDEAFGRKWLSILVGCGVIATGVVSAATLSRAFIGFLQDLFDVPMAVGITVIIVTITGIAIRGILESVLVATVITVIEVGGLLWVLAVNAKSFNKLADRVPEMVPDFSWDEWSGILVASFLAFYAFIGFEDMVNEAEEVKNPRRNLPRGILFALLITTVLYVLIGLVAVLAVAPEKLAESKTPLARTCFRTRTTSSSIDDRDQHAVRDEWCFGADCDVVASRVWNVCSGEWPPHPGNHPSEVAYAGVCNSVDGRNDIGSGPVVTIGVARENHQRNHACEFCLRQRSTGATETESRRAAR